MELIQLEREREEEFLFILFEKTGICMEFIQLKKGGNPVWILFDKTGMCMEFTQLEKEEFLCTVFGDKAEFP